MRIVVAVVVYDRVDNVRRWIECWSKSLRENCQLVIIHNHSKTEHYDEIRRLVGIVGATFISRSNIGYDIGAMQDVCRRRLEDFPYDYDRILWCTDDTLPMRRDFVQLFSNFMDDRGLSLACMELSKEVRAHVRTTGFMMNREQFEQLQFPADPITNKAQCYDFEHRVQNFMLLHQANKFLNGAAQYGDIEDSPLWDTGHRSRAAIKRAKRREIEFNREWYTEMTAEQAKTDPLVAFICPVYNNFLQIVSSLQAQTYKNWVLYLIHDGPPTSKWMEEHRSYFKEVLKDRRIHFQITAQRSGNWGHTIRQQWIRNANIGDYVVVTNADNYHVPTYIEQMLSGFDSDSTVATYCAKMVHNYVAFDTIDCRLERGYVDCAGVMVRADVARSVGWNNLNDHSADWLYFVDIMKRYGEQSFKKVKGCLLIHN